jgi:hypothetical protein
MITRTPIDPGQRSTEALAGARLVADRAPLLDRYGVGWQEVTDSVRIPYELRSIRGLQTASDDRVELAADAGYVRDVSNSMRAGWTRRDAEWVLTPKGLAALGDPDLCDRLAAHVRDWIDRGRRGFPDMVESGEYQLALIDAARPTAAQGTGNVELQGRRA